MRSRFLRSSFVLAPLAALSLLSACSDDAATTEAELPPAGLAGLASGGDGGPAANEAPTGLLALARDEKIVTVGESVFTRADFERAMIHMAARVGLPPGHLPPEATAALEMPAFKQMLKRGLLFEEAKKRGVVATDEELKQERDRLVAKLTEGRTLADVLKAMRTDEEHFERDLKVDISVAKLMEQFYGALPKIDEKAARALYTEDKQRWGNDDRASVSHILVQVSADAPPDVVKAATKKAEQVREKVLGKGKATFAKVAKEESDDPGSKVNGGDLGWFARREMLPGFAEAAFALKDGEVSPVLRTDKGFHVLLGQGVKKQTVPFEKVKERIIATESLAQRTEAEQKLLATLEENTKIEIHHEPRGLPAMPPVDAAAAGAAVGAAAGAGGHGGMAGAGGAGGHSGIPLPSADNVLPGAQNPHGGGDLKLDTAATGTMPNLKLKMGTASPSPAPGTP